MKRNFLTILFMAIVLTFVFSVGSVFASGKNWDEYESGRNNIRLDGFQGQPGYIVFYDGDGNIQGYVFACRGGLIWVSAGNPMLDLDNIPLTTNFGERVLTTSDTRSDTSDR